MEKYKPEPGYREPYTEYGMEIVMFCAKHCLTKKALAAEAGIPYDSLLATIKGRRSGHNVKAAVAPVMARYPLPVICPLCLTGDEIDTITYDNFGTKVRLYLFDRPGGEN